MLKRRVIPLELYCDGRLVKTIQFASQRDVGDPVKSTQVYSDQDADEILILDISRDSSARNNFKKAVKLISRNCFVPLSVGGGIRTIADVGALFDAGADKVVINSAAYRNIEVLEKAARKHGSQAIIAAVDVYTDSAGSFLLYSDRARRREPVDLSAHLCALVQSGAGELFIQSINRDGMMTGYALEVLRMVVRFSPVPVIVAGGAGNFVHLREAFQCGADGAACGSLFNFGDNSPLRAKAFLKNYGVALKSI